MFSKKSAAFTEAEKVINDLAFSFLRGSANESPQARNALGDRLAALAPQLSAKEQSKLRSNPPNIVTAFPPEGRRNFESFLTHAFG